MVRYLRKGDDGTELYKRAQKEYEKEYNEVFPYKETVDLLVDADKTIREYLKKDNYTKEDLNNIASVKYDLFRSKKIMLMYAEDAGDDFRQNLEEFKDYVYDKLNYKNFKGNIAWTRKRPATRKDVTAWDLQWEIDNPNVYGTEIEEEETPIFKKKPFVFSKKKAIHPTWYDRMNWLKEVKEGKEGKIINWSPNLQNVKPGPYHYVRDGGYALTPDGNLQPDISIIGSEKSGKKKKKEKETGRGQIMSIMTQKQRQEKESEDRWIPFDNYLRKERLDLWRRTNKNKKDLIEVAHEEVLKQTIKEIEELDKAYKDGWSGINEEDYSNQMIELRAIQEEAIRFGNKIREIEKENKKRDEENFKRAKMIEEKTKEEEGIPTNRQVNIIQQLVDAEKEYDEMQQTIRGTSIVTGKQIGRAHV